MHTTAPRYAPTVLATHTMEERVDLTPRPKQYLEVTILVPAEDSEAAEGSLLARGALGTASEERPGGRIQVRGFFSEQVTVSREEIVASFRALAASDQAPEVSLCLAPWRNWAAESQAAFRSFAATTDLTIAPPWDPEAGDRGAILIIQPGAAFGVGSHATTRGCLDLIPRPGEPVPRSGALDVGTGTGVLALRARQCGYGPVIAFDNDPIAIEAALENVRLNATIDPLHLFVGEIEALGPLPTYSLITANIFLNPLLAVTEQLVARLARGGVLILSGIRENDAPELLAVYARAGAVVEDRRGDDGWAALRLRVP